MLILPLDANTVMTILNLPAEMASNPIFQEHSALVLAHLANLVSAADYALVTEATPAGEDDPTAAAQVAFRFGYSFLLLASTCEFLNLKTLGEGIVKTIGLDASATQLLTGTEIEAFKARLTLRALKSLAPYLNEDGLALMAEVDTTRTGRIRVAII